MKKTCTLTISASNYNDHPCLPEPPSVTTLYTIFDGESPVAIDLPLEEAMIFIAQHLDELADENETRACRLDNGQVALQSRNKRRDQFRTHRVLTQRQWDKFHDLVLDNGGDPIHLPLHASSVSCGGLHPVHGDM